ncbi:hypothetical protein FY528_14915 [Hymenobacter lutimineralis]|uniref:Copper-binding protein MbnP-like domain-containing protein n=1 Tax=Hymenobacter lutimineralis TaxID=2606448 RepID=A0A5D6UXC4_9BACT|nr:MbnP family protein [Hymenobacter lutimineralis]TYZ07647.1 hypothetical protein FY528_14915 [Hymenobacter lutimineralis]
MFLRSFPLLCLLAFASFFTACTDDTDTNLNPAPSQPGTLDVEIDHVAGTEPLAFNTTYTTAAGDKFTVSRLKYYLSNFTLGKTDGSSYLVPESYFLVDEADPESKFFTLADIPSGDYTSLSFTIGVDSTRNVSGAQTGALDPINNMFWTWDYGYIFTKLEGTSPQAPNQALVFHIGGFKKPNNTIRSVSPTLRGITIPIRKDRNPAVHLKADVLRLFTGPNTIRFATTPNVMGGADAVKIADNQRAGFFTVDHVHTN